MVQIVEQGPSDLSRFLQRASPALDPLIEHMKQSRENKALERLGIQAGGIRDPNIKRQLLAGEQKRKEKEASGLQDLEIQKTITDYFGEAAGEVYPVLTEGGKTKFVEEIFDTLRRGGDVTKIVSKYEEIGGKKLQPKEVRVTEEEVIPEGEVEDTEIQERTQQEAGLTPKERISREETRYKTNLPLHQETSKKLESTESEEISIKHLQNLNESGKLPSGLARWNIKITGDNQGELRFPWLANQETQDFIKSINDFTTKAKDSFGARVTNFELARFMKRLPGLLNSEEGRRAVLNQMEIINKINSLHSQGILNEIERSGGIRRIDYDVAERAANRRNKKQIDELKKEYISLESGKAKLDKKEKEFKKVPKGTKLTTEKAREIFQGLGKDKEKAIKFAEELGYDISG